MLVTKKIDLHMAHKLTNYNGACKNIHGHTYIIEIGVEGDIITTKGSNEGMVVDFTILKKILNENIHSIYDHCCVIYKNDEFVEHFKDMKKKGMKVIITDYNPTAEYYAKEWFKVINDSLQEEINLTLKYIDIWETSTSCARYTLEDFKKEKPKGQKNLFESVM